MARARACGAEESAGGGRAHLAVVFGGRARLVLGSEELKCLDCGGGLVDVQAPKDPHCLVLNQDLLGVRRRGGAGSGTHLLISFLPRLH